MPLAFVWTREPNFQSKAILLYLSSGSAPECRKLTHRYFFELLRRLNVDYLSSSTSLKIVFMTDWCDWHARQKNVFSCALNLRKEFLDGQMWLKIIVFFYLHNINFFLILLIISWYYKSHYALQHSFVLFFDASFYILDKKEFNDLFKYLLSLSLFYRFAHATRLTNISCSSSSTSTTLYNHEHLVDDVETEEVFQFFSFFRSYTRGSQNVFI